MRIPVKFIIIGIAIIALIIGDIYFITNPPINGKGINGYQVCGLITSIVTVVGIIGLLISGIVEYWDEDIVISFKRFKL